MEHLWRLLLDWPQACGMSRREEEYAACRRVCRQTQTGGGFAVALESVMVAELLRMPICNWLALGQMHWQAWRESSPSLAAKLLRQLDGIGHAVKPVITCLPRTMAKDWVAQVQKIAQPDFCGAPTWLGEPCETGVLARQLGHLRVAMLLAEGRNIEARLVARLVELARWAQGDHGQLQDWTDAVFCEDGIGLARVETARGILIHRVRVKNGVVAEYAIVAPTEWNFHPQGAFVREAPSLGAVDEEVLLRQAHWLALSLDPCVEFGIKISHA